MCNTKVSSSPKDTFPKAQHFCFLSIHYIIFFDECTLYFCFKMWGTVRSFKTKLFQSPTSVVEMFV